MERPLKERLAGAIIIVALAVVFVPTLFDGEGHREFSRVQVEMPEPPALVFGQHFPGFDDEAAPAPAAVPASPTVAPTAGTARSVPPRRPPIVAAPPAQATQTASRLGLWVVQTGVFAIRKNADDQRARLRKAGFDPVFYKRHEKRPGEIVYYVRIGPYEERPAAVSIAERLRREHGVEALVKAYGDND